METNLRITDIPSMGAQAIGPKLKAYAQRVKDGDAIVELGVWLGAGTAWMAEGVKTSGADVHIHAYDRFDASKSERVKAAKQGWDIKGDTRPKVKSALKSLGLIPYVTLYKGPICSTPWSGQTIGLQVIDACKRAGSFLKAIEMYSPSWEAGYTVLVLMDYWFFKYRKDEGLKFQYNWMQERLDSFSELDMHMSDGSPSSAAFLYTGGVV